MGQDDECPDARLESMISPLLEVEGAFPAVSCVALAYGYAHLTPAAFVDIIMPKPCAAYL